MKNIKLNKRQYALIDNFISRKENTKINFDSNIFYQFSENKFKLEYREIDKKMLESFLELEFKKNKNLAWFNKGANKIKSYKEHLNIFINDFNLLKKQLTETYLYNENLELELNLFLSNYFKTYQNLFLIQTSYVRMNKINEIKQDNIIANNQSILDKARQYYDNLLKQQQKIINNLEKDYNLISNLNKLEFDLEKDNDETFKLFKKIIHNYLKN